MAKKNMNTEAMSFTMSGVFDFENMTLENDGVFYSLKDKLKKYDGCIIDLGCATAVDILPLRQE